MNRNPLWTNTLICLFTKGESCTLQSHVCIHVLDCVMNSGPRGISIWIMQYWVPYSVMVSTGRQRIQSVSSNICYTYQIWLNTSEIFFHFWQFNGILFSLWNNIMFFTKWLQSHLWLITCNLFSASFSLWRLCQNRMTCYNRMTCHNRFTSSFGPC